MENLNVDERKFWEDFLKASGEIPSETALISAAPAGNFDITDSLISLYKEGKKTAGSGLVEDYESAGDPLPKVGDYWIVLNSSKEPTLILKTIKTEIYKFKNVPQSVAIAEGEGDLSLKYWREEHAKFFRPYLKEWGIDDLNEAHSIVEFFEMVFSS